MFHKIITMIVAFLGFTLNVTAIAGIAGAVYTMTNAVNGNKIVIYNRANDGQTHWVQKNHLFSVKTSGSCFLSLT